jgi:hypothetical protein
VILFYISAAIIFILSRPRREFGFYFVVFMILFYISAAILFYISAVTGVLDFYFGVFSVDRSFSVRPNLGHVGFSCGNQEKLSVLTLNKLGFVNDVRVCRGFRRPKADTCVSC